MQIKRIVLAVFLIASPASARNKYDSLPPRVSQQSTQPVVAPVIIAPLNLTPVQNDSVQMALDVNTLLTQANGNFNTQAAAINLLVAAVQDLQARVTVLENPTPPTQPTPTTINADLTKLPVGPLSGSVGTTIGNITWNIGWNSGMWTATANGVSAVMQGSRNFVLPAGQTLLSVTLDCPTNACAGTFTDSAGETVSFSIAQGSPTVLNTGWNKVSGAVSLTMTAGPATGLNLQAMSWN